MARATWRDSRATSVTFAFDAAPIAFDMVLISFDMGPDRLDMALAAVDMALAAVDMALAAVDTARGDFAMREIFVEPPTEESRIVRRDRNVPSVAKSHAKTANGRFVG